MTPTGPAVQATTFDRILECAVMLSWHDVMRDADGQIHIECSNDADRSVEFLKVWSSRLRGNWSLVCEYWMEPRATIAAGVTYSNGYASAGLSEMLDMIMQHQGAFPSTSLPLGTDLIQIHKPTASDLPAARRCMAAAVAATAH
jgi:hypothetical protein